MPRQIIDTESSRPAYIRRRAIQIAAVAVLVVLAVAVAAFFAHSRHLIPQVQGSVSRVAFHTRPSRIAPGPGNTVPGGGTTLVTLFSRSIHAA